jgi:type VI secretion system secreted protein VgrG
MVGEEHAPFTFEVDGLPAGHFSVVSFRGKERLSGPYTFDVEAFASGQAESEGALAWVGRRARFSWRVDRARRTVHGIVAKVRVRNGRGHEHGARYRFRLVPRLWLLKSRKDSRVFQQRSVDQVVSAALHRAGIGARFQLRGPLPVREYCTQFNETDLDFVRRICAEAGIFFHFPQVAPAPDWREPGSGLFPGDSVCFGDDALAYPHAGEAGSEGAKLSLFYRPAEGMGTPQVDKVVRFSLAASVRSSAAAFRVFDPERPHVPLVGTASTSAPGGELSRAPAAGVTDDLALAGAHYELEVYEHDSPFLFPKWDDVRGEAPLALRRQRRRAVEARGASNCPWLAPGHRFSLEEHPLAELNRPYVVTEIEHRGRAEADADGAHGPYENTFSCVPAEVTYCPPRPPRRQIEVALTATVAGPPGEDIHTNALGQVKVQFHWDRTGGFDDSSSCWVRTMQPWAGTGWGALFLPRVGTEVVVTFENGDPDKPLVLGGLYNGTQPPPFHLPQEKAKSGLKTRSTPGRKGQNELWFDDAEGLEQIYLHARRDLSQVVENDARQEVRGDAAVLVHGKHSLSVRGAASVAVAGLEERIGGDTSRLTDGKRAEVVGGDAELHVRGSLTERVDGREQRAVHGRADVVYGDDLTHRVRGSMTTIVGTPDRKRSFGVHAEGAARLHGTEAVELTSDKEIILAVGKSAVRITSDAIELCSPTIRVKSDKTTLSVGDDLECTSKGQAQIACGRRVTRTRAAAA